MSRRPIHRRRLLRQVGTALAWFGGQSLFTVPGAFAELLSPTPRQSAGPFYPDQLPLDVDNDLIIIGDSLTPAVGTVTHLRGRILDIRGQPQRHARVEIWQVDAHGVYLHSRSGGRTRRDPHFQGYGRFETASDGAYYFRTVKPVPYPGRTPHIHVAVTLPGQSRWTTQCYIRGEPQNRRDALLNSIRDPQARRAVEVDFIPIPDSPAGELAARFDIVMGVTPPG